MSNQTRKINEKSFGNQAYNSLTEVEIVPPQGTNETSDMIDPICEDFDTNFKGPGLGNCSRLK